MDLPPPPPPLPLYLHHQPHHSHRHHPHHHQLRYENVIHPPDFCPRPYSHNIPPPPPPPYRRLSHPHPPSLSNLSPHRSRHFEIVSPPKPDPHHSHLLHPPPPLPEMRNNTHLRLVHDYPARSPILADEIFWRAHDLGNRERYPGNICGIQELYNGRDDLDRRGVIGVGYRGRDLYDERRVLNRVSDFNKKVDYSETRQDSINGWIRGLYRDVYHDERSADSRVSNRGRELCREGSNDERRWYHGSNDEGLLPSGNRQPKCMKNVSSSGRFSRRLGSGVSEGDLVRSKKKRKVRGKAANRRIQSGKNCSSYDGAHKCVPIQKEPVEGSFRGEEKDGFKSLRTGTDGNREREESLDLAISFKSNALVAKAILAPPRPDVKTDTTLSLMKTELTSSKSGTPTVKSSEDAVKIDRLASCQDPQSNLNDTSKELVDKAVVPESGNVECDANEAGEIAGEDQTQKVISFQGPTSTRSVRVQQSQLRKKRKARKKFFLESNMHMKRDESHIIPFSSSESVQPSSDTALPECGGSWKPCGPNLKRKSSSLTSSASVNVPDSVIPNSLDHAERLETSTENVDAENYSHETFLSNENICPVNSMGLNQHCTNVNSNAQKTEMERIDQFDNLLPEISVFNAQKAEMERIDQFDNLLPDKVDDISELPLLENYGANGPSEVIGSLDGIAIAGLSQENQCSPEILASNASSESDSVVPKEPEDGNYTDAQSKVVFLNVVNTPQVVVDSVEYRSLEDVTMSDCSYVIPTPTDYLPARHGGILVGVCSQNDLSKKASIDVSGSAEGSFEAQKNAKTCISDDYSSNVTLMKKAPSAQIGFSDIDVASGVSTSDEVGLLLAKVPVPATETEFLGERRKSEEVDKSSRGPSRVEKRMLELAFHPNDLYPSCSKKRKVTSPKSNLSSFSEDEMVADGLSGDCSKLYQRFTELSNSEAEKNEGSTFSRKIEPLPCQPENEMICGRENVSGRKPGSSDINLFSSRKSVEKVASDKSQINANLSRSLPEANHGAVKKSYNVHCKQAVSLNQLITASPKVFPGNPSYFSNSKKLQPTQGSKPRTWHRNGSSSVAVTETKLQSSSSPQSHGTKTDQTIPSSYIRKGNSLVRNPSPAVTGVPHSSSRSVYRLTPSPDISKNSGLVRNPSPPAVTSGSHYPSHSVYRLTPGTDDLKDNQATDCKTGEADVLSITRMKPVNNTEMPSETKDALEECMKSSGVLGQADSGISSKNQGTPDEVNLQKKIMYVKRRSNQLIAASSSENMSTLGVDKKGQASSSDGYYKRKKNQLVRSLSGNHGKKADANGNSRRLVSRAILPRLCTRQQSGIANRSKLSFVWKLHDMHSTERHKTSVVPQKVVPRLFSWKRTAHWRSFMHALSTKPNKSSFSTSRQTLLFSRKRGAIYTRSTHGYSLRMSKVLSVSGSSLKWSKAIEKSAKKANEEATRAVAVAEKRKKEENGVIPIASKSINNVSRKLVLSVQLHPGTPLCYPGERIFRVGSERYKMDPTRRTLHRITAEKEEASSPVVLQTEKNVKRSYVPRRLYIGHEEYVRIGNGNQLVRDPKKRTRVLASEKVRWSLRTARLRMARKKKFCQFFTRFGKCNKDDGKCPYIHDPSKIAVCTKFLNGSCTNLDCKLTHKVIPERMEDCSYFLKGSCSNENCPYRHVNVDPDSTVCKSFLRGYCADGNECRKKHTYVCPAYEALGSCPNQSSCKLHHPKKKTEKQQPLIEQKTLKGRYFDGGLIGKADSTDILTERAPANGKDEMVLNGKKYPDYISLDVDDDDDDDDEMDQAWDSDEQMPDFDVLV
ncbi:zinc finger CCCH domain-containing protein 7 [Striga asiatica]|uniref:Zinc finger CCCH domain-containing protein 7 n=1 Tax=Striga asiatica TaxID=4170 RepID=A0A5A7QVY9_STRAF|nr:zinc finger CCCH domain-containing protein 7 [Striga asiatica]